MLCQLPKRSISLLQSVKGSAPFTEMKSVRWGEKI